MTNIIQSSSQHPLSFADFRWLWIGQAISTFGDRFTTIAIPIVVYNVTGSNLHLGFAFIAQVLAGLVFGLWAGAFSDRWDRRRTMITADLLRAFLVLTIPYILSRSFSVTLQIVLIYLVSFSIAAVTQFFTPAKIGMIPDTVPEEQLVAANALENGTSRVTEFAGYALAGIMLEWMSATVAFGIDAITFLLSAVFISLISKAASNQTAAVANRRTPIIDSIREGLVAIRQDALLRAVTIYSLLAPIAIGAMMPLHVLFARDVLQINNSGYGYMQAAISLGIAFGILAIGRYAPNMARGRMLRYAVLYMGVFLVISTLLPVMAFEFIPMMRSYTLMLLLPFILLMAVANGGTFLAIRTIIQENASDKIGRVYSVTMVVSSLAFAIGMSLVVLADYVSVVNLLAFWGIYLFAAGILGRVSPELR